ncbi:transcription initiation factor TFIID subunit 6 isoform X2 [Drosophila busckii]|uniref:transcription initiation factor TFIID subunit 6 isoform X2 n=1 Tax=Drosophila busckii TaxID=30019 RepID=UPI00083EA55B|nr:transcription initiation factor TFIID subunit 6 isoform X2 [Drosophila busckii]
MNQDFPEIPKNSWDKTFTTTLSRKSLNSISEFYIGETLSDTTILTVQLDLRKEITQVIVEAAKYARRTTHSSKIKMEHLQYALRDQNSDFYILQVDYTGAESERFYKNELLFESLKSRVSIPTTKQKLNDKSNASNVIPRPKHIRKCDLVLLMPIKKFPLSKEQQEFYVLITETCMGASESVRREALQRLQLDSSLQPMAPTLCTFISDAVKVNVVQKNFVLLVYLMRMVHALLGNSNLQLQSYVHLLISSVLSCCVANQLCAYSSAQNHWALREFAAIIMIDILKLFSNVDKSILPRVLRVYKNGLQSAVLPTIYGCAVGLSKLGG